MSMGFFKSHFSLKLNDGSVRIGGNGIAGIVKPNENDGRTIVSPHISAFGPGASPALTPGCAQGGKAGAVMRPLYKRNPARPTPGTLNARVAPTRDDGIGFASATEMAPETGANVSGHCATK